ncbi:MAG: hypothetical protein FWG67_00130 [Defluviitaleaceae bacterium]|nr:hypothetical protein [Defluviitaleaceae bacterium]
MKYIRGVFEDFEYLIEIDDQHIPLRQISLEDGNVEISCRFDCLAEGKVFIEDLDGFVEYIDKNIFENRWKLEANKYLDEWRLEKESNHLGNSVTGVIKYFYPQGIIIQTESVQAIFPVRNHESINQIHSGSKITGVVAGYDETNMWLILKDVKLLK